MSGMPILVVLTFMFVSVFVFSQPTLPIAKTGCPDVCGDLSVPYPFGMTQGCAHHYSFWVSCNHSFTPPKLFLQDSNVEVTGISLSGQLRILHYTARDCYSRNGTRIYNNSPSLTLPTHLTVNNTANKLTIVGCDAYAFVSGQRLSRNYMTGCAAVCDSEGDLTEGDCTGAGCCQTSIPGGAWSVEVELQSLWNYSYVSDFDRCGYAFLVEESEFRFSAANLTNLGRVEKVPLVVDWALGNGTCEEALGGGAYACVSGDSRCFEPRNGVGYRCRCEDGFRGSAC